MDSRTRLGQIWGFLDPEQILFPVDYWLIYSISSRVFSSGLCSRINDTSDILRLISRLSHSQTLYAQKYSFKILKINLYTFNSEHCQCSTKTQPDILLAQHCISTFRMKISCFGNIAWKFLFLLSWNFISGQCLDMWPPTSGLITSGISVLYILVMELLFHDQICNV